MSECYCMDLERRIQTWQNAARHHALPYYGMTVVIEPLLRQKALRVLRAHVLQTWLETPANNVIRVLYKRSAKFDGRRIQLRVNDDEPTYFGPDDIAALENLLRAL